MLRLGDACGVRLPDRVVAEADTVQDLVEAVLREESGAAQGTGLRSPVRVGSTTAVAAPVCSPAVRAGSRATNSRCGNLDRDFATARAR